MQNLELQSFISDTDIFCRSKFILFDNKLRNYLKSVSNCDMVFNLLAKCLKNFDYDNERNKAAKDGFRLPTKAERAIALVFCVLVDIDAAKINFYSFLNEFFFDEDINKSLNRFFEKLIVPFKNMIIVLLEGSEVADGEESLKTVNESQDNENKDNEEKEEETTRGEEVSLKTIMINAVNEIVEFVGEKHNFKETRIILSAMLYAAANGKLDLFEALRVALLNSSKDRKFNKFVKIVFAQLYE